MWWEVESSPSTYDLSKVAGATTTSCFIDAWLKNAETLTGASGRGGAPKKDDMQHLGNLAGWRCQFAGCGKDLQRESLSGTPGNFSYFAHIIASSPKVVRFASSRNDLPQGQALLRGRSKVSRWRGR